MSSKITELTAITTLTDDDLFEVVDDPSGSPNNRKVTFGSLISTLLGNVSFTEGAQDLVGAMATSSARVSLTFSDALNTITPDLVASSVTYAYMQNVSATDKILGRSSSGAGVIEEITCTSYARSILDDTDASTARTTLGLGTAALLASSAVLLVANNLSDVTAATARTNLGLVIGTNVQAWDSDLDTWATKTAPSGTVIGTSDTQTLTNKTLTSPIINVGSDATGDMYYRNAGVLARVAIGSSGTVLSSNGSVPSWAALGGTGGILNSVTVVSNADYTILPASDQVIHMAPTSANRTVTAGVATSLQNKAQLIMNTSNSGYTAIIAVPASSYLNGVLNGTHSLGGLESAILVQETSTTYFLH